LVSGEQQGSAGDCPRRAASSKALFAAAKVNGVAGVYLWMYGPEDPGTWPALRAVLPIVGPNASSTSAAVP
jgi:hypothetical protein